MGQHQLWDQEGTKFPVNTADTFVFRLATSGDVIAYCGCGVTLLEVEDGVLEESKQCVG